MAVVKLVPQGLTICGSRLRQLKLVCMYHNTAAFKGTADVCRMRANTILVQQVVQENTTSMHLDAV